MILFPQGRRFLGKKMALGVANPDSNERFQLALPCHPQRSQRLFRGATYARQLRVQGDGHR